MWRNYTECSRETERWKAWKKSLRDLEDKNVQKSPSGYFKEKNVKEWEREIMLKCITVNSFQNCSDKSSISGNWKNFKQHKWK